MLFILKMSHIILNNVPSRVYVMPKPLSTSWFPLHTIYLIAEKHLHKAVDCSLSIYMMIYEKTRGKELKEVGENNV